MCNPEENRGVNGGKKAKQCESEKECDDATEETCVFGHRTRYIVLVLATFCLSTILSNILTFNFTYICMTAPIGLLHNALQPHHIHVENVTWNSTSNSNSTPPSTKPIDYDILELNDEFKKSHDAFIDRLMEENKPEFDYTSNTKSMLFAAVAVGALLGVFPITFLLQKLGARRVFSLVGVVSALSTAMVPMAARAGVPYLMVTRVFQGIGLAACLPIIGSITAHWATLKQIGVFTALLSSFLQIAPVFTMPVAGELCVHDLGWPAVYYLHAAITVVLFAAFVLYFRDAPRKHPCVGTVEAGKIARGKAEHRSKQVPYAAIMKTPAIWAIWVAAAGNFFGTQLVLQFTPTYLNKVLGFPVESTGFNSALPSFIMFFIKMGAGLTSDKVTCLPETLKLRVYNSLAVGGQGFFFIALAFVPPAEATLGLVVLVCATSILGFNSGGFFKSTTMIARHHSHFVMGHISFINCVCMLLDPVIVDLIAPENTPEQWRWVFLFHAAVMIVSNVYFCIFASGKPAIWATDAWKNDKSKNHQVFTVQEKPVDMIP